MSARTSQTSESSSSSLNEFRKEFLEFVNFVRDQFKGMQEQFQGVQEQFHGIQEQNQEQFKLLYTGQSEIRSELNHLNRKVGKLEVSIEDMRDENFILTTGLDEALEHIVDHEDRINRLERKVTA